MANGYFGGGDGTELSPFIIEDAFDLNTIRQHAMSESYFTVVNDINMDIPPFNGIGGWEPIPRFNGMIYGNGHKITNLKCEPIPGGRQDVGFILYNDPRTSSYVRNLHFEDINFTSGESADDIFTFFGFLFHSTSPAVFQTQSFSITGVVNNKIAPGRNVNGFIFRDIHTGSSNIPSANNSTLYINIVNIGNERLSLFGQRASAPAYIRYINIIFKGTGKFAVRPIHHLVVSHSTFIILSTPQLDISNIHDSIIKAQESECLYPGQGVIPESWELLESNGKIFWDFPGTTHVVPRDIKRHKFLLGTNNEAYTYSEDAGLTKVANYPITGGMILESGFDYLDSIPPEVWQQIRNTYGNVEIYKHLTAIPSKTPETKQVQLSYIQDLDDKVIMEVPIDFNLHNNDISKITIE